MPSFWISSRPPARGSCLGRKPPLAPDGTITAFLTSCARTRPSTSVRKSCARSDQRMPPRAIGREAQVDALHARRVDPDLAERARLRRRLHRLAVELEGERGRAAGRSASRLVEVGAHGGADQVQELAQDAVLIQARHGGQRAFDALRGPAPRPPAAAAGSSLRSRIEAQVEQLEQVARERRHGG